MKVGFLGVQCDTANMGLAALAYAGVALVRDAIAGEAEFVLFSVNSAAELTRMSEQLGLADTQVRARPFRHKSPLALAESAREMRSCDVLIDFTGGDSFSDIYGTKRLLRKLFHKQMAIGSGTPLILAPQTYGPLVRGLARPWYRHVIDRAALVYTRDDLSAAFLRTLSNREVRVATDVAVTLPWDSGRYDFPDSNGSRVGINVSGLLWNGGYTGKNQFDLRTDYRQYCGALVDGLMRAGHEVHLVPHVLTRGWESATEDDVRASVELQASHPYCQLAPRFSSPIEAKSYISGMHAFLGSRMHATIAAFTTGVPTVPVAYSRKFQGFFGALGYDVSVDLTTMSTRDAVATSIDFVSDTNSLRASMAPAVESAQRQIQVFTDGLMGILSTKDRSFR